MTVSGSASQGRRPAALWHFTCEHTREEVGDEGDLVPGVDLVDKTRHPRMPWTASFVWLTDMRIPDREGLGLTMRLVHCDRSAYRYRVVDTSSCRWWPHVARMLPREIRDSVEEIPGVRPVHWWLSRLPVPVVYDPVPVRVAS